MIEARNLTRRYGPTVAVDALSFDVRPGSVTGFLGPNGSGKSTTMRLILGLDRPDAGQVRVGGRRYRELRWPLREVGALLEARAFHPGRSARSHLAALAASNAIPRARVDEVLDMVGLTSAAGRRAGKFSLGMGQRLGVAAALLGDPAVLLLDEPVNGLDPEGVRWIRDLLKSLAAQGRTVFVSSHLISEMALTAERLVVIGRGRQGHSALSLLRTERGYADLQFAEIFVAIVGVGDVKALQAYLHEVSPARHCQIDRLRACTQCRRRESKGDRLDLLDGVHRNPLASAPAGLGVHGMPDRKQLGDPVVTCD
ncbi:ATP-binding cassette domain-containing protein [Actinophytocola sp.]|uniref:ATP-binding cassette domain-containing protein n=1 Tax=Actinophytocola sp. TaxID=1872138 RepID=UPI003D6A85B8